MASHTREMEEGRKGEEVGGLENESVQLETIYHKTVEDDRLTGKSLACLKCSSCGDRFALYKCSIMQAKNPRLWVGKVYEKL